MKRIPGTKIAVVLIILCLAAVFVVFDLDRYITLAYIRQSQQYFADLYERSPVAVIAAYMGVYVAVTALSLPGAAVMTLAGGALFGFAVGTIAVSFASTVGAAIACFVARFVLRNWVRKKIGPRFEKLNRGVEREGAFYLFTLRLVPLFPFWTINIAMGLTKMPMLTFYWVSQLGMLPGTMVYVNAGKELANIDSPADVMSPGLLVSFALLGIFPLLVKKTVAFYRARTGSVLPDEQSGTL